MTSSDRENWPDYRICRECAETGATVLGNDGNYRHNDCARDMNSWPYLEGRDRVLGASITAYRGGEVRVTPSLRHITSRLDVAQFARRLAVLDDDYVTLHPSVTFGANGEDGEVLPDGGRSISTATDQNGGEE